MDKLKAVASFEKCTNTQIPVMLLVMANFVYNKTSNIIECLHCGLVLEDWTKEKNYLNFHRIASPTCSFILDYHSRLTKQQDIQEKKLNTSKIQPETPKEYNQEDIDYENIYNCATTRLCTFLVNRHIKISNDFLLAINGFYYKNDNIICAFCGKYLYNWEDENPIPYHKTACPECPFVLKEKKGIQDLKKYQSIDDVIYMSEIIRYNTFETWPTTAKYKDPYLLAKNGFLYTKENDCVQCVFCFVRINSWNENDNPFMKHKTHSPKCLFVNNVNRGLQDLDDVLENGITSIYGYTDLDMLVKYDQQQNIKKNALIADNEIINKLIKENNDLKDLITCKICLSNEVNVAALPCGHCYCETCFKEIVNCSVCRTYIRCKSNMFL